MDVLFLSKNQQYTDAVNLSLESIKKYCLTPINNIYLISPDKITINGIQSFTDEEWLYEFLIPNIGIHYFNKNKEIWNYYWEKQQYIKLSTPWFIKGIDDYLLVDPDAFLLNQFAPIEDNKQNFIMSPSDGGSYYRLNEKLFGIKNQTDHFFIVEVMLFKKFILSKIKDYLENKYGDFWLVSINKEIQSLRQSYPDEYFFMAEPEIYGNFMLAFYPDMVGKLHYSKHNFFRKKIPFDISSLSLADLENFVRKDDSIKYKEIPDFIRWIKNVELNL